MKKGTFKSLLFAVFCGFCAFGATAATSLFSNYGQIQNVQNYSSNPFWTPNSPYNQRLPQPVYVQGADLTAEDCFKVVQSKVAVQCMARDNCKNSTLSDIRPIIMVELSNLPGNNYVSACSGYIDAVFESYVAQFGSNVPNRAVAFPNATAPNQNLNNNNTIQIQNPYKQEIPQWQQEIKERSQELQELQQQNGAGSEHLSATDFPMTYDDLSFSEKVALKTADYAQYKDMNAYVVPNFQNEEEWCTGKGAGTPECKPYEQQQALQQQVQNGQQNTTPAQTATTTTTTTPAPTTANDDAQVEGLCLKNKKFDLATEANTIFAKIQVQSPKVAQQLTQELIQCSTEPRLEATENKTSDDNDDLLQVKNNKHEIVHKVRFDDITENNPLTFGMDTIKALCLVASSTAFNRSCPTATQCFSNCSELAPAQFEKISNLVQQMIAPEGSNFQGGTFYKGTHCYKLTYTKSTGILKYSVFQTRNCKSEILSQ